MKTTDKILPLVKPIVKPAALCFLALVLSACEGDARPLTEAVEANDINLASIIILPPANSIEPLNISPGAPLQFSIRGTTLDGSSISVSGTDRRWVSSNESVATVSSDGVVLGRRNGDVTIGVRVAGAVAVDFPLRVSDAPIQRIQSIVGNNGDNELSSCLPVDFSAIGNYGVDAFGNDDLRAISGLEWRVDPSSRAAGAETFSRPSTPFGAITLVGRQPTGNGVSNVVLTATLPADQDLEQAELTLSRSFEVSDTLSEIEVTPNNVIVEEGDTVQLSATANFSNQMGQVLVTEGVDWTVELSPSPNVASVGTVGANPGLVTGLAMGQATITALCGNNSASTNVTVEDSSGSLSFNRNGSLTLDLVDDRIYDELRVSTGDDFSTNRDVTNEADWSSSDVSVVTVDSDDAGNDRGTLTLISEGPATITAEFNDVEIEIEVTVENEFSLGQ